MRNVTPGLVVGVNTEAIAGEGLILTAGGIDTHIHFICGGERAYYVTRGRYRPGVRVLRHHVYAVPQPRRDDVEVERRVPPELRVHREGQHVKT
jgi:hypothetical protein